MPDILHQLPIAAPPERVFDAIASQEGLSAWWTNQVDGESRLGTILVFRFGGSSTVFRMRVEELANSA